MKHNWETVKIGSIATQQKRIAKVDAKSDYNLIGIRSNNEGVFFRESKSGNDIFSNNLLQVNEGDFIYSRLSAPSGGFGVVTEEFDNCFVSNEFPVFEIDKNLSSSKFLFYYFSQKSVLYQLQSKGTGRTRFSEAEFCNQEILLPPLKVQNKILTTLEKVNSSIEEIKALRAEQEKDISNFRYSVFEKLFTEYGSCEIGKLIEEKLDPVIVDPTAEYLFAGVYGFGKGLFIRGIQNGNDTTYKSFNRLHTNQIVMSQPKGWEGAITLIPEEFNRLFLSPVYSTFDVIENNNIRYVAEFCKLPTTWQKMLDVSKGIGARRNSIYAKDFLKIEIPNIPIEEQDRIVELLEKINEIKQTHKEQEAELKQLMPSLLDKAFKGEL